MYDVQEKICSLNADNGRIRKCDITIGTQQPDFQTCVDEGKLEWASGWKDDKRTTEAIENKNDSTTGL